MFNYNFLHHTIRVFPYLHCEFSQPALPSPILSSHHTAPYQRDHNQNTVGWKFLSYILRYIQSDLNQILATEVFLYVFLRDDLSPVRCVAEMTQFRIDIYREKHQCRFEINQQTLLQKNCSSGGNYYWCICCIKLYIHQYGHCYEFWAKSVVFE